MAIKKRGENPLLRNKKGISHEIFFNVFEIILAAIVVLALLNFIRSVVDSTIFEKNYLSRDLAILTNIIYGAQGDVVYTYKEKTGKFPFTFDFRPNKIEVDESRKLTASIPLGENKKLHEQEKEELTGTVSYPFGENKNLVFGYTTLESGKGEVKLNFIKSGDSVSVNKAKISSTLGDSSGISKNDNK